jgi:hypothetical protein
MVKTKNVVTVKPGIGFYIILAVTIALVSYHFFNPLLDYFTLLYPWNYAALVGTGGISMLMSYSIVDNWSEAWASRELQDRIKHFINVGAVITLAGLSSFALIQGFIYIGGEFDWGFYILFGASITSMILGCFLANLVKSANKPAGLVKKVKKRHIN